MTGEEGYPDDRFGPFRECTWDLATAFGCAASIIKSLESSRNRMSTSGTTGLREETVPAGKEAGRLYTPRNSTLMIEYANGRCWFIGAYQPIEKGSHPWMEKDLSDAEVDMRKQAWSIWEAFGIMSRALSTQDRTNAYPAAAT